MPDVLAHGRWRSGDELNTIAEGWLAAVDDRLDDSERPIAVALPTTPESLALLVGLTSLPRPLVILPTDVRAWRTEPPIPARTPLLLLPALAHLAPDAEKFGLVPLVLPEASTRATGRPFVPYGGAGVVLFTSGSLGPPKPIFDRMDTLIALMQNRLRSLRLAPGAGIAMEASLAYSQGFTYLATAILLGGPVGLLDPRDHRLALATLANPVFHCWRATVHFADALSRCILTGPPIVPALCFVSMAVSHALFDAFLDRFQTPLRQVYSTTETGTVSLDDSPPDRVQRDTVGRPLDGIEVRIGERPSEPLAAGEIGPVWVRSPWQMVGYGFPPDIEPRNDDGWWPTRDLGRLQSDGYLALAGRSDDAIRTRDNRTVNLTHVAGALREIDGVTDAVVLAIEMPVGRSFGAVVQCENGLDATDLRSRLALTLPPWSWPRTFAVVTALPRLPNGKPDRQACARLLAETPST